MAQLTPQDFEALWQKAQNDAANRASAPTPKVRVDTSLSAILDRYGTLADTFLAQRKIRRIQHDAPLVAIAALKTALAAINEKDLVAQHFAEAAQAVRRQCRDRITSLAAPHEL
jgi:hypothetical protein